ncbi:hypothetical protein ACE40W_18525 [Enterococcus avium]|uniref:hypothetical protein n=1 Tax=Enterococcus avium TaxID=33945 RepID=UPI0035CA4559
MEVTEEGETVLNVDLTDFPTIAWAYRAERFSLYNEDWTYELSLQIKSQAKNWKESYLD